MLQAVLAGEADQVPVRSGCSSLRNCVAEKIIRARGHREKCARGVVEARKYLCTND